MPVCARLPALPPVELPRLAGRLAALAAADKRFQEELVVQNSFGNGIGQPYKRSCSIPQGDPLSMFLYVIYIEPFLIMLERKLDGIMLGNFKI